MNAKTYLAVGELMQAAAHQHGIVGPVQFTVCRAEAALGSNEAFRASRVHPIYAEAKQPWDTTLRDLHSGNSAWEFAGRTGFQATAVCLLFSRFQNAGYLGLYNMMNTSLAKRRNVDPKQLVECMGRTELAANLFRITQTEERIKNFQVKGQSQLEKTHFDVGREVREMVQTNTGRSPEDLPVESQLGTVQKELRSGYRKMLKEDGPKKPSKKADPRPE